MKEFKHTQIGYFLLIAYSAVILIFCYLIVVTDFHPITLAGLIIMLTALGLFVTLTVRISQQKLSINFGLGILRKSFLLKDVQAYQVVKNPWYYGWGIRYTPRGWNFSVSGLSAIELKMKSGKIYRIGTDDPQSFAQALDEALNLSPAL